MAKHQPMHNFVALPPGKRVQDVLPWFKGVKHEAPPLGTPCPYCASCRKLFTPARRRRYDLKIIPLHIQLPLIFLYHLCGACSHKYQIGGEEKEGVLAAVEQFIEGEKSQ